MIYVYKLWIVMSVLLTLQCCKCCVGQTLQADVSMTLTGSSWNYSVTNLEPGTSFNWVTSFYLPIHAQISNITSPNLWTVDTDGLNYVLWSNQESYPYSNDIAPGGTLTGFSFENSGLGEAVNSTVSSWDHNVDDTGPNVTKSVFAPFAPPTAVPEPSGYAILLGFVAAGTAAKLRRRQRRSTIHRWSI